jgi:hypothetical protein
MMTNEDIQNRYHFFNRKYFGNRLPKDMVVRFSDVDGLGVLHTQWDRPLYIYISKKMRYSWSNSCMTLLHEMVHVEFPKLEHGPTFHRRMLKLARQGAFRPYW